MSRKGKKEILIPEKTEVTFVSGTLKAKGPQGEISRDFRPTVGIKIADGKVTLEPLSSSLETKALWGTYASHITNMISGVNKLFEKKLIVEGVGFRSDVKGNIITMSLGFSHPVSVEIPADVKVTAEKNVITITGVNKESVGQFAARVRSFKKPEPYKGTGIRYDDEVVRRKQGKKSV